MSRIDDLIRELCPTGVPFQRLGEICDVRAGSNINKNLIAANPGKYPVVNSGREPLGYFAEYNVEDDPIGIASRGSVGLVTWTPGRYFRGNLNYSCTPTDSQNLNARFLYHMLLERSYEISDLCTHDGIPALNASNLKKLQLQVPALAVQEEILRILDSFTELAAELEAELEARTTQYEETRNRLMDLDVVEGHPLAALVRELCPEGVPRVRLEQVASYSPSRVECVELSANSFIGVDNLLAGKRGRVDSSHVPMTGRVTAYSVGDILLGNIRPYLKKIWLATNDGGCSGDVLAIRIKEELRQALEPRFLYYALSSDIFFEYDVQFSKGTKMPRGDKRSIMKYPFSLPPLAIQAEVVRILDSFDSLVNDLSAGLPAEIDARRKQYEYYRDKLLTFEELVA